MSRYSRCAAVQAARVHVAGHRGLRLVGLGLQRGDDLAPVFGQATDAFVAPALGLFVIVGVAPVIGQPNLRQIVDLVLQPELFLPQPGTFEQSGTSGPMICVRLYHTASSNSPANARHACCSPDTGRRSALLFEMWHPRQSAWRLVKSFVPPRCNGRLGGQPRGAQACRTSGTASRRGPAPRGGSAPTSGYASGGVGGSSLSVPTMLSIAAIHGAHPIRLELAMP